ncbi:hypothetical protein V5N11_013248 [Cardamine amara subsp. amara]|uniref:Uncharacterized protein n=1 Tax=Cardamine amara subsp. amara TaxID=228776 RepID=A0ABD1BE71_CARAN
MAEEKLRLTGLEKLRADALGIISCVGQLKSLHNHFLTVEANVEKRSRELDLKEKELEKRRQFFEAEKTKAGDLKKLVEECTQELRTKQNQLSAKLDGLKRIQIELDLKDKQWKQVMAEIRGRCNEARKVQERKMEMEQETGRKSQDLALILVKIQESDKLLEKMSQEVECKEKELQILNFNREKRGEDFEVEKSEADLKMEIDGLKKDVEEKGKELNLVKSQVKSWEKKLIQIRKLVVDDDDRFEAMNTPVLHTYKRKKKESG